MSSPRLTRVVEDVDALSGTIVEILATQGEHTTTLAEHGQALAQVRKTQGEHTTTLAEHTETLAKHGQALQKIQAALADILAAVQK